MPELLQYPSLEEQTLDPQIEQIDFPEGMLFQPEHDEVTQVMPVEQGDAGAIEQPPQPETPTLHSRIFRHVGRIAAIAAAGLGFAFGASTVDAAPAEASSDKVYTTTDNVYLHADPGLGDKDDLIKIMPKGTKFTADCYVNDTPIGKRNNPAWLHGTDETGATGYFTDAYSDSRWDRNNTLHDQGLAFCGEGKQPRQEQPSGRPDGEVLVTPIYDREKTAAWAKEHAEDKPKYRASCTNFASQALWEGGLPKDDKWTSEGEFGRIQKRPGTKAAWSVEHFRSYLTSRYPQSDEVTLDGSRFKNNRVPEAQIGDVILYDWQNDGSYDHATIVTGIVGDHYPKVSEWSIYDGTEPTRYPDRGWTHSEKDDLWLQHPTKYPKVVALLIHIDTEQRGEF